MPSLYERLMGVHATRPKIPIDGFQAVLGEFARGKLNQSQALTNMGALSGDAQGNPVTLDTLEQQEAGDLVTKINNASGVANKVAVTTEIRDVLMLGELGCPSYDTTAKLRTSLGVQTRN